MFETMLLAAILGWQPPADAPAPADPPPAPAAPEGAQDAIPVFPPRVAETQPPPTDRPIPLTPPVAAPPRTTTSLPAQNMRPADAPAHSRTPGPPTLSPGRGGGGSRAPAAVYAPYGVAPLGRAGEMAGEYVYYSRRHLDPKEGELEKKSREIAGNYHREPDAKKKVDLKASLQTLVAEQFQIRQARRAEELKKLEEELKRLKDAMDKREATKDAIIARRIAELTGEDDLGF